MSFQQSLALWTNRSLKEKTYFYLTMTPKNLPNKSRLLFFAAVTLLLSSFFTLWFQFETLSFVPRVDPLLVSAFNDRANGGQSKVNILESSGNKIEFSYSLEEGYEYPYAGISIEDSSNNSFDLRNFDVLRISLVATAGEKIPISFNAYPPIYTNPNDPASLVPFEHEIVLKKGQQNYVIPLDQFEVPQWWNKEHQVDSVISFTSLSDAVKTVNIENCTVLPLGAKDQIKIFRLALEKDKSLAYLLFWLGILTLTLGLVSQKMSNKKQLEIFYTPTESSVQNKENPDILGFIGLHYANEELSISTLKQAFGLSEHTITEQIRSGSGMTFKQYLNSIRLTESKRLLKETTLSISEIAYQVGYKNVSHFNRVFKSSEGLAPGAFRNETNP